MAVDIFRCTKKQRIIIMGLKLQVMQLTSDATFHSFIPLQDSPGRIKTRMMMERMEGEKSLVSRQSLASSLGLEDNALDSAFLDITPSASHHSFFLSLTPSPPSLISLTGKVVAAQETSLVN